MPLHGAPHMIVVAVDIDRQDVEVHRHTERREQRVEAVCRTKPNEAVQRLHFGIGRVVAHQIPEARRVAFDQHSRIAVLVDEPSHVAQVSAVPRTELDAPTIARRQHFEGRAGTHGPRRPPNSTWAGLMRRAFAIDVLACPRCGGQLRMVGTVEDPVAVREVLAAPRPAEPGGPDPPPGAPTMGY